MYYLQRLPGADRSDCFLFDDSHLHKGIGRPMLREHGDEIVPFPGVAAALVRLAGLLKPTHVFPWSLLGIDGLANLVFACVRSIGDKSNSLPSPDLRYRVFGRDRAVSGVGGRGPQAAHPVRPVLSAARGAFRSHPQGSPTWAGYRSGYRLDLVFSRCLVDLDRAQPGDDSDGLDV